MATVSSWIRSLMRLPIPLRFPISLWSWRMCPIRTVAGACMCSGHPMSPQLTNGNNTDTCINAYVLGDLSQQGGTNNVWINNVSQSVLTAANPSCGRYCGNRNAPILAGDAIGVTDKNITWSNNVTYGGIGVSLFDNDARAPYFSCNNNRCNTNPLLVNPASGNFALQSGSPAIAYGQAKIYIPPPPVDAGACSKAFTTCP